MVLQYTIGGLSLILFLFRILQPKFMEITNTVKILLMFLQIILSKTQVQSIA